MHTAKFENSSGNYIFDKVDFNDFLDFLEKEKRFYKFDELKPLKELSKRKYKDVISSETQDNLIVLESSLKSDIRKSIISNKDIIVELINELSTYILEGREVSFFDRIEDDIYINEAINVLTDKYNNILNANVIDTNEN